MSWTNVSKPSVASWNQVNPQGREVYDQADIDYDSSATYYDGLNPNQWTNQSKPTSSTWTKINKPT